MFQIGDAERELNRRAELFWRVRHGVISVADNEAAKRASSSFCDVDVFVVGHTAPEHTTKQMVDWLKANFPTVGMVALIPSATRQLRCADYNVVLNDLDEWMNPRGGHCELIPRLCLAVAARITRGSRITNRVGVRI